MNSKEEIINEIQESLLQKADILRNADLNTSDKLDILNVILNTYKFLQNYDYNIAVLQKDLDSKEYDRGR